MSYDKLRESRNTHVKGRYLFGKNKRKPYFLVRAGTTSGVVYLGGVTLPVGLIGKKVRFSVEVVT